MIIVILGLMTLTVWPTLAAGQGRVVHGEDSVFTGPGVAIAWGVLRAAVEDDAQVIVRIAIASRSYGYVSVDGVDPFTQARRPVLLARPVTDVVDVRSARTSFADFPRREVRLYRTPDDWRAGAIALTVYYLGVPDTTPEFASEAAVLAYLAAAIVKAQAAGGGCAP